MLREANKARLVEIARNPNTAPSNRVDACKLITKCGLLPASEVLSILQCVIDDYRSKDNVIVKAMAMMDIIEDSAEDKQELSEEQTQIVENALLKEYLECPSEQS